MRDGSAQLVVTLTPIERLLDVLTQGRGINVIKQVETFDDVVIFPKGTLGFVFAGIGAEFADDDTLSCGFEGQRNHDALNIFPIFSDETGIDFSDGFNDPVVLTRMLKAIERLADPLVDVLVARCKLIAEAVENGKIDVIGSVSIRGMDVRLDVGRIVEQKVEDKMALVLVSADDFGVDRDMIRHQRVGNNAFFKPEVFWRMARVDRVSLSFKFLPVAAGMQSMSNIVMVENREFGKRVADEVVGFLERFQANEVVGCPGELVIAEITDVTHSAQPNVGGPGNQAGDDHPRVGFLFGVASQHVIQDTDKRTMLIDKKEQTSDIDLLEQIKKRVIDRFIGAWILKCPVPMGATTFDLKMVVFSGGNAPIDLGNPRFKGLLECFEMLCNRLFEDGQTRRRQQFFLFLPLMVSQQIVFKTAKANAVSAKDVAGFQSMTQKPVD